MSKRFKITCPVCKEGILHFVESKAEIRKSKHFTTDCGLCGSTLVVDIPNKRQVNVEELTLTYQGQELKPMGYITI